MSFNKDELRKLALLARMNLSDDQIAAIGPQLESILSFADQLSELNTDDIEPMTTALDVDNRWREDVVVQGLSREDALRNAPASDEECFLVPAVLGTVATKADH